MNELVNSITPALEKLSELFSVSVDYIQANLIDFVLRYGRYAMANEIIDGFIVLGCIIVAIFLVVLFVCCAFVCPDDEEEWSDFKATMKRVGKLLLIAFLVIYIVICATTFLIYIVDPEIYSIKKFLDLVA